MTPVTYISGLFSIFFIILIFIGINEYKESVFRIGISGLLFSLIFGFGVCACCIPIGDAKTEYHKPDSFFKNEKCIVAVLDGEAYVNEIAKNVNISNENNVRVKTVTSKNSYGFECEVLKSIVVLSDEELKVIVE